MVEINKATQLINEEPRFTEMLQYDPNKEASPLNANLQNSFGGDRRTQRFDGLTIIGGEDDLHEDIERVEEANNSNLWGFLRQGEESFLLEGAEKIDMGQFDEGDRQFLIIDRDNLQVYDMRKMGDMERLSTQTEASSRITEGNNDSKLTLGKIDQSFDQRPCTIKKANPWGDFWKEKKMNNNDLLVAAETGDLESLKKLLDPKVKQAAVADLNTQIDGFYALHFAASECQVQIVEELVSRPDINLEPLNNMQRTPLHLAAQRGSLDICRILCKFKINKDAKDQDDNTPLHLASENGQIMCLIYLSKEVGCDVESKNKYGHKPFDVAFNLEVRNVFEKLFQQLNMKADNSQLNYGRTAFNGVLHHNDRVTKLKSLMHKFGQVEKHLERSNHNEKIMLDRMEAEEEHKTEGGGPELKLDDGKPKQQMRWKNKFIKIWKLSEQLKQEELQDQTVGPNNFTAIMKLGQGSFGVVYLVEKLRFQDKQEPIRTGKYYAMKILNKKQILGQNLVKYAKTERDVLTYTKHPFIVGLKYAFQTPEKLFLLLEYAPGGNMSRSLQKERRFSEVIARFYLAEILLALEDLHKKDIIFRDLKPDNIVFDGEGHAMLTDFGLSKEGVLNNNQAKSFCGSPAYLSPEILKRSGHGKSVDWYLLGVLLYEMMVGIPPYYSNNKQVQIKANCCREQLYQNIEMGPLQLPKFLSDESKALLVAVSNHRSHLFQLLNRNPLKRLGSGKRDAEEIKEHIFFTKANINWQDVRNKKLPVPPCVPKKILIQDIPSDKVYGRGAFDDTLKNLNRVQQWTYIQKTT